MKYLWLFLVGCGGYANAIPDLNPPPGRDVKRIQQSGALLRTDWERTRWARPNDSPDLNMVYFVVGDDGTACIVASEIWALVQTGDAVRCTPWRIAR